jgi:hypothetical protein
MQVKEDKELPEALFNQNEDLELARLRRAFQEISEKLGVGKMTADVLGTVLDKLVREALNRAKPNRRMAYLLQFGDFLCTLPDALERTPEVEREKLVRLKVKEFRLRDAKGRKESGVITSARRGLVKIWVRRDGELWEAEVPQEDLYKDYDPVGFVDLDAWRQFRSGESIFQDDHPTSPVDLTRVRLLRPRDPASVLLKEFEKLYPALKAQEDLGRLDLRDKLFPDVPRGLFNKWVEGGPPTASEMALLVAAHRAKLKASRKNLSTLWHYLGGAKQARQERKATHESGSGESG